MRFDFFFVELMFNQKGEIKIQHKNLIFPIQLFDDEKTTISDVQALYQNTDEEIS